MSDLAPKTSIIPPVKPGDFDLRQTNMQEDLADLEFRVDLEKSISKNPIAKLGFDPEAAEIYPYGNTNAKYITEQNNPERLRAHYKRKDQNNPVRAQFSKDIDPGDVVAYGDAAKSPIWAHEFTHRGVAQIAKAAQSNPEEFKAKYGEEALFLLQNIAQDKNKDEQISEMFDDFDTWMNINKPDGTTESKRMGDFQDFKAPGALEKKKEFQEFLTDRFRGVEGSKEEKAYRANGLLGILEAAEDMLLERGSPPPTPAPKERNALGRMVTGQKYKPKYAKGGEVMEPALVDPVSGNEIPPGGTPEGVRDDVDAKLSEGEFVIPQNVVDFYGMEFFEGIINKAKEKLGDDSLMVHEEEEEMLEEMPAEEVPMMATGGPVINTMTGETVSTGTGATQPSWTSLGVAGGVPWASMTGGSPAAGGRTWTRKIYINKAGEKRVITFRNGQPIQPIPEGFVENTKDNRDRFNTQDKATVATPKTEQLDQGDGWLEEKSKLGEEVNGKTGEIRGFDPEKFANMSSDEIYESAVRGMKGGDIAEMAMKTAAGIALPMLGNAIMPGMGGLLGRGAGKLAGKAIDANVQVGVPRAVALSERLRANGDVTMADKLLSDAAANVGMGIEEFRGSQFYERGMGMFESTYSQGLSGGAGTSRVTGAAGSDRVSTGGGYRTSGGSGAESGAGEERAAANAQTAADRGTAPAGSGRGEVSFGSNVSSGGGNVQSATDMVSGTRTPDTQQSFGSDVGSVNTGVTSQDDFQDGGFSMGTPMKKGGLVTRPKAKPKAKTKSKGLVKRKS